MGSLISLQGREGQKTEVSAGPSLLGTQFSEDQRTRTHRLLLTSDQTAVPLIAAVQAAWQADKTSSADTVKEGILK